MIGLRQVDGMAGSPLWSAFAAVVRVRIGTLGVPIRTLAQRTYATLPTPCGNGWGLGTRWIRAFAQVSGVFETLSVILPVVP